MDVQLSAGSAAQEAHKQDVQILTLGFSLKDNAPVLEVLLPEEEETKWLDAKTAYLLFPMQVLRFYHRITVLKN